MKYCFNDRNLALIAALSCTDGTAVPSAAIFRTDHNENAGSADVTISGPYTGQHDTVIDIEILDGEGDSSQTSLPVLTGIGTGTLDDLTATALPAQDVSITLTDLGTPTQTAQAPFQGQILQAADPGPDGNLISISVDPSTLDISTDPVGTLHAPIQAGTSVYSGPQYDGFGAVALNPDGTIPDAAPRVRIGHDVTVFRLAKKFNFTTNAFDFIFSPTPVRDIDAGANVYTVTGDWSFAILVSGVVAETYTGVVTLFDALHSIDAGSSVVVLSAPPLNDKSPNGQGIVDLSVWTRPYILAETADGTDFVKNADFGFALDTTAPTAAVAVRCTDDSILGAEEWEVLDGVNVGLPTAVTGEPYIGGPYTMLIPAQVPRPGSPNGNISVDFNFMPRPEGQPQPAGRVVLAALGARARNATYTFQLVRKPAADCAEDHPTGEPIAHCLGIEPEGGGTVTDESRLLRLQRLTSFVRTFKQGVTSPPSVSLDHNLDWVDDSAAIFHECLNTVAEGTLVLDTWALSTVYAVDDMREASPRNGYRYAISAVSGDATSGATPPTFPTTVGDTVTDHNVTWKNIGKTPWGMFDDAFDQWTAEANDMLGDPVTVPAIPPTPAGPANSDPDPIPYIAGGYAVYDPDGAYAEGKIVVPVGQNPLTAHFAFELVTIDVTGSCTTGTNSPLLRAEAGEPTWVATLGAETSESGGALCFSGGFASGSAAATISWKCHINTVALGPPTGAIPGTPAYTFYPNALAADVDPDFFERYQAMANDVIAAAGIDPTFKGASTKGDGCWQDYNDNPNWFKNTDGPLLPFQQGHGYHSEALQLDPDTGELVPESTEEFFIKLAFRCDLVIGDSFTVTISNVSGGPKAYQVGDVQTFSIVHADPLQFGGGQNGTDLHRWTVQGDSIFADYLMLTATPPDRIGSHAYLAGDKYKPATPNAHWYICTVGGTSAASAPTFTTDGSSFTDGTATFQDAGLLDGYTNNGLSFAIHEGGIPFDLGDVWRFRIEGGHFRSRRDGGAWSSSTVIGTTDLGDGLSLGFAGGNAPSYVAGDAYSFEAIAVNGPDNLKTPTKGRFNWTGSTTIVLDQSGAADGVLIADHTIPDTATIALQGSNDNFATTVISATLPWEEGNIFHAFTLTTAAKWRLQITMGVDEPGSIFWLWVAEAPAMKIWNGSNDVGSLTKNCRLPDGIGTRAGIGYEIVHERLSKASFKDFMASLNDACRNYSGRFGVIPNDLEEDECGIVEANIASLSVKDIKGFQPRDISTAEGQRRHGFTLTVDPLQ